MEEQKGFKNTNSASSQLSGCYLLIVIGEPNSIEHRDVILQKITKGFLSWDMEATGCCISAELQYLVDQSPIPEDAKNGERLIQFVSEQLVTEVLINPQATTLQQCIKNLLSSYTKHKHIIHSGYTFAGSGSWILQDSTFSFADFLDTFQDTEVQRIFKAYENCITVHVHCAPEGDWSTKNIEKEPWSKLVHASINPNDKCTTLHGVTNFVEFVGRYVIAQPLEEILEPSDVVGNIRFSRPTLYVFPGGQGDSALFGVNGFNMLIDGGFNRRACFWDFARHLDRVDAMLVTRVSNSNMNGVSSFLKRKVMTSAAGQVYPKIGHMFCNIVDRKHSPDGDKDTDSLLISLAEEGDLMMENLRHIGLKPQNCYRDDDDSADPLNLYHKVGHGKLDMYVLNPAKDSKEVKEFLRQWHSQSSALGSSKLGLKVGGDKEVIFPVPNLMSICAILVWQPADPTDSITRILFPGSSPQSKIFEGLEKIRPAGIFQAPVCSENSLQSFKATIIRTEKAKQARVLGPSRISTSKMATDEHAPTKLLQQPTRPEKKHEPIKIVPKMEEKKVSSAEVPKIAPKVDIKVAPKIETRKPEVRKATLEKKAEPRKVQVIGGKVVETAAKVTNGIAVKSLTPPKPMAAPKAKGLKEATNKKAVEEKNIAMKKEANKKEAIKKVTRHTSVGVATTTVGKITKVPAASIKPQADVDNKPSSDDKQQANSEKAIKIGDQDNVAVEEQSLKESILKDVDKEYSKDTNLNHVTNKEDTEENNDKYVQEVAQQETVPEPMSPPFPPLLKETEDDVNVIAQLLPDKDMDTEDTLETTCESFINTTDDVKSEVVRERTDVDETEDVRNKALKAVEVGTYDNTEVTKGYADETEHIEISSLDTESDVTMSHIQPDFTEGKELFPFVMSSTRDNLAKDEANQLKDSLKALPQHVDGNLDEKHDVGHINEIPDFPIFEMCTMSSPTKAEVDVDNQKLEVEDQKLEVEDQMPEVDDQKREVGDQKREVDDQKPEVDDQKPEVDDHIPEVDEQIPEVDDQIPEVELFKKCVFKSESIDNDNMVRTNDVLKNVLDEPRQKTGSITQSITDEAIQKIDTPLEAPICDANSNSNIPECMEAVVKSATVEDAAPIKGHDEHIPPVEPKQKFAVSEMDINKASIILSPITEDAPKLNKMGLATQPSMQTHQPEFLRTPDEVADLPIHEEVTTEYDGYYHIRGALHRIPETLAEHDSPIGELKAAVQMDKPDVPHQGYSFQMDDSVNDIGIEDDIHISTLKADHAEVVTISNGTSASSSPLSLKSPNDNEVGQPASNIQPTTVTDINIVATKDTSQPTQANDSDKMIKIENVHEKEVDEIDKSWMSMNKMDVQEMETEKRVPEKHKKEDENIQLKLEAHVSSNESQFKPSNPEEGFGERPIQREDFTEADKLHGILMDNQDTNDSLDPLPSWHTETEITDKDQGKTTGDDGRLEEITVTVHKEANSQEDLNETSLRHDNWQNSEELKQNNEPSQMTSFISVTSDIECQNQNASTFGVRKDIHIAIPNNSMDKETEHTRTTHYEDIISEIPHGGNLEYISKDVSSRDTNNESANEIETVCISKETDFKDLPKVNEAQIGMDIGANISLNDDVKKTSHAKDAMKTLDSAEDIEAKETSRDKGVMGSTLDNAKEVEAKETSKHIHTMETSQNVVLQETVKDIEAKQSSKDVGTLKDVHIQETSKDISGQDTLKDNEVKETSMDIVSKETSINIELKESSKDLDRGDTSKDVDCKITSKDVDSKITPKDVVIEGTLKDLDANEFVKDTASKERVEDVGVKATSKDADINETLNDTHYHEPLKDKTFDQNGSSKRSDDTVLHSIEIEKTPETIDFKETSNEIDVRKTSSDLELTGPSEVTDVKETAMLVNLKQIHTDIQSKETSRDSMKTETPFDFYDRDIPTLSITKDDDDSDQFTIDEYNLDTHQIKGIPSYNDIIQATKGQEDSGDILGSSSSSTTDDHNASTIIDEIMRSQIVDPMTQSFYDESTAAHEEHQSPIVSCDDGKLTDNSQQYVVQVQHELKATNDHTLTEPSKPVSSGIPDVTCTQPIDLENDEYIKTITADVKHSDIPESHLTASSSATTTTISNTNVTSTDGDFKKAFKEIHNGNISESTITTSTNSSTDKTKELSKDIDLTEASKGIDKKEVTESSFITSTITSKDGAMGDSKDMDFTDTVTGIDTKKVAESSFTTLTTTTDNATAHSKDVDLTETFHEKDVKNQQASTTTLTTTSDGTDLTELTSKNVDFSVACKEVDSKETFKDADNQETIEASTKQAVAQKPIYQPGDKEYEGYYEVHSQKMYGLVAPSAEAATEIAETPETFSTSRVSLDILPEMERSQSALSDRSLEQMKVDDNQQIPELLALSQKELNHSDEKDCEEEPSVAIKAKGVSLLSHPFYDEDHLDHMKNDNTSFYETSTTTTTAIDPEAMDVDDMDNNICRRDRSETFISEPLDAQGNYAPKSRRDYDSDIGFETTKDTLFQVHPTPPSHPQGQYDVGHYPPSYYHYQMEQYDDSRAVGKMLPDVTQSPMHSGSYVSADEDTEDDYGHGRVSGQSDADNESPYHRPVQANTLHDRMMTTGGYKASPPPPITAGADSTSDESDTDNAGSHRAPPHYGQRSERYYDISEQQKRRGGGGNVVDERGSYRGYAEGHITEGRGAGGQGGTGGRGGTNWESASPVQQMQSPEEASENERFAHVDSGKHLEVEAAEQPWETLRNYPRPCYPSEEEPIQSYAGFPPYHPPANDSSTDDSDEATDSSSAALSPKGFDMDSPEVRHLPLQFQRGRIKHDQELGAGGGPSSLDSPSSPYDGKSPMDEEQKNPSSSKNPFHDWGEPMGLPSPIPPVAGAGRTLKNAAVIKMNGKVDETAAMTKGQPPASPKRFVGQKGSPIKTMNKRPESPAEQRKLNKAHHGHHPYPNHQPPPPIYVDLTYVPHHGNPMYSDVEFFRTVRARYYVFSGTNPSKEVFDALLTAKQSWDNPDLEVTIIPTYDTDTLGYWFALHEDELAKHKIDLAPSASRCTINLQDHETSCSAYRLEF